MRAVPARGRRQAPPRGAASGGTRRATARAQSRCACHGSGFAGRRRRTSSRQASRKITVASSGVGSELNAEAMLACTTPGWTSAPPTRTGTGPACVACAIARCSDGARRMIGHSGRRRRRRPVPRGRRQLRLADQRPAFGVLSRVRGQLFERFAVRLWLKPLSDCPWVQRWMIVSPTSALAGEAIPAASTSASAKRRRGRAEIRSKLRNATKGPRRI